jgi:hypothetical protein
MPRLAFNRKDTGRRIDWQGKAPAAANPCGFGSEVLFPFAAGPSRELLNQNHTKTMDF